MDGGLIETDDTRVATVARLGPPPAGMPPEAPAEMPAQDLARAPAAPPARGQDADLRRFLVLGGAGLISAFALFEMSAVLTVAGFSPIKAVMLVLFTLNLGWIALAFTTALAGFVIELGRLRRRPPPPVVRPDGRTAVLMPTYNEAPDRVFAALEAMAAEIAETGAGDRFDWIVLSDTTDPSIALAEKTALAEARRRLAGRAAMYYRRRRINIGRKAGNVAEFCRRWGGAYDHLLVLDADSMMEASTILELVRRMEASPETGLIQTVPRLTRGVTLMARLQQFAGRVYGPVLGSGLAWWSGGEGNFWGHNAIIRTRAFTEAAGLPVLPGKPPFGGHIMSHDFVEAALLRRAGWRVELAADLGGSYEEGPPTLVDLAVRERRWCQGNLQHMRVVTASGLHWVSRLHLITGIMSYLASPLWLMLICSGLLLAWQAHYVTPEYFPQSFQLFPSWPTVDPERAFRLFGITMAILFGPKLFGLVAFLLNGRARRAAGGTIRVMVSFVAEFVLSALIAPVMMVIQCGLVGSIVAGRDAGWSPQRREGAAIPLADLFRRHRWHMVAGIALALAAYMVSPVLLAWLAPAIVGLIIAVPLSALTGSPRIGAAAMRWKVLATPEETQEPEVYTRAEPLLADYRQAVGTTPDLAGLVSDAERRRAHVALVAGSAARRRGDVDPLEAVAGAKIAEAATLAEALSFLTREEQATVIAMPHLLESLARLPVSEPPSPPAAQAA